jgi:hypothetical protein
MGADMAIAICPVVVSKEVAEARLKSLTNGQIYEAINYGDMDFYDDTINYKEHAVEWLSWVYGESRQTTYFVIDNVTYICSGGLSWGDHPTDAYYPLECVSLLALSDTQENWEKTWQLSS